MFKKLIGNHHVKEILKRLKGARRVPNALLFAGADGVGKRQFALELAKSFVCQNPSGGEACDGCSACHRAVKFVFPIPTDKNKDEFKKVFTSEHIDVGMVIHYKNTILVDAIRSLETEANFRPYEAKARFFIIDEADKMNDAASNALLKTLEEPPPTSHIFLVSSRPDSLLPTIRSRCQTLRFAPIPASEIEDYLLAEGKFSPADARLVAGLSAGSVGRALDFDLAKFREQRGTMLKALESIIGRKDYAALLKTGEEIADAKNKEDYEFHLEILQTLIHDAWTLRLGADETNLVNVDIRPQIEKLSAQAESDGFSRWLGEIEVLRENLAVNLNRKIATDALFLQMAG
jgi:DNA polymerase III subunit delta'